MRISIAECFCSAGERNVSSVGGICQDIFSTVLVDNNTLRMLSNRQIAWSRGVRGLIPGRLVHFFLSLYLLEGNHFHIKGVTRGQNTLIFQKQALPAMESEAKAGSPR